LMFLSCYRSKVNLVDTGDVSGSTDGHDLQNGYERYG
jgi:hypothetical protein